METESPQLFARAESHGDRTAIVAAGRAHTYRELLDASAIAARVLLSGRDNLREERIAFLVTPGFDHVVAQWAIWRAGGLAVPLPVAHPPNELEYLVRDSEATTVLMDEAGRERLERIAAAAGVRFLTTNDVKGTDGHGPSAL